MNGSCSELLEHVGGNIKQQHDDWHVQCECGNPTEAERKNKCETKSNPDRTRAGLGPVSVRSQWDSAAGWWRWCSFWMASLCPLDRRWVLNLLLSYKPRRENLSERVSDHIVLHFSPTGWSLTNQSTQQTQNPRVDAQTLLKWRFFLRRNKLFKVSRLWLKSEPPHSPRWSDVSSSKTSNQTFSKTAWILFCLCGDTLVPSSLLNCFSWAALEWFQTQTTFLRSHHIISISSRDEVVPEPSWTWSCSESTRSSAW